MGSGNGLLGGNLRGSRVAGLYCCFRCPSDATVSTHTQSGKDTYIVDLCQLMTWQQYSKLHINKFVYRCFLLKHYLPLVYICMFYRFVFLMCVERFVWEIKKSTVMSNHQVLKSPCITHRDTHRHTELPCEHRGRLWGQRRRRSLKDTVCHLTLSACDT